VILSFFTKKSPYLYCQFARKPGEKKKYIRTPIRKDDPNIKAKMASFRAELEAKMEQPPDETDRTTAWEWVASFLKIRYHNRPGTLRVYRAQWKWLARYAYEHDLRTPIAWSREHCFAFVTWRIEKVKQKSGRNVSVNTAIGELKLLAILMDEACNRRLILENPARKLGLERESPALKPAMTDDEIRKIDEALRAEPEWMSRAFAIALNTGLRFSETRLHRRQVLWDRNRIDIDKPKGGRGRAFGIEIYDSIKPMIRAWLDSSDSYFWTVGNMEAGITGLIWHKFFRKIELPHLCFHCTRTTFITRGAESGVPEGLMMKLVNHASVEVHRIYQRLSPGGAQSAVARMAIPVLGVASGQSQKGKPSCRETSEIPPARTGLARSRS
jgi:integrase